MAAEGTSADVKVGTVDVEKDPKVEKPEGREKKTAQGKKNQRFTKEYSEERRRSWEETQKLKPVLETLLKGKVKWYSIKGRYGFIDREDGKGDVFIHQSVIANSHTEKYYLRTLANGEEVLFDIVQGNKGLEASNVTGPNGDPVQGSKYFFVLLKNRRHPHQIKNKATETEKVPENKEEEKKTDKKKKRHAPRRNRRNKNTDESAPQKDEKEPVSTDSEKKGPRRRRRASSTAAEKPTIEKTTNDKPTGAVLGGGDASLGSAAAVDAQI